MSTEILVLSSPDVTAASESERVEVQLSYDANGRPRVVIENQSYGPGIGWYTQKAITLSADQVEAVLKKLCSCRHLCHRAAEVDDRRPEAAEVVPFPG